MTWVEPRVEDPVPFGDPDDPLVRLSDAAEAAHDKYATAIYEVTEAEILYRRAWDSIYAATRPGVKSNADAASAADRQVRDAWANWKRAEAVEKSADKGLRTTLARLSAFQTVARSVQVQAG